MNKSKKILAGLSAVVMAFSVGCGGKSNSTENSVVYYDDSNSYAQNAEGVDNNGNEGNVQEATSNPIPTIAMNINDKIDVSGVDVKVLNVYDVGTLESDTSYNYDRQALAFVCELTNNTDAEIKVNSFDMAIEYLDGEQIQFTTNAQAMMKAMEKITDIKMFNETVVAPGQTVKGYVPFAVYSRWETLTMYYEPSFLAEECAVSVDVTKDRVEVK